MGPTRAGGGELAGHNLTRVLWSAGDLGSDILASADKAAGWGGVILEGSEPRSHLASVKQPHGEEQALTFAQRSPS